jgi:hypothetical protein
MENPSTTAAPAAASPVRRAPARPVRPATPANAAARPTPSTPAGAVSRLAQAKRGRQKTARRMMIHGAGGLGKTTLASSAPGCIFIDLNQGSHGFDVARYPFDDAGRTKPESFEELLGGARDIARSGKAGGYETLAIDTLSDVEQLIWADVVRKDGKAASIVDGNLGFNKGYEAAVNEWRRLVAVLELAWSNGINVILLDHSEVKKEKNASGADYGSFMPKIHPTASRHLHTWCDYTFFLQVETILTPDSGDERKAKKIFADSTGRRLLHARPAGEWMAKSRPEMEDPLELPEFGGWEFISSEIRIARVRRIDAFVATLSDASAEKVRALLEKAGEDDSKLEELDDWCAAAAAKGV